MSCGTNQKQTSLDGWCKPRHNTALNEDFSVQDSFCGFDESAGSSWIYPTNYEVRDYQFNIVKSSIYRNTLVTLPTGLGKTFIAAVIMFNFYRWYPSSKIVFMAPTKPLVAQQIQACYNIMGIPQEDTIEMTGALPPTDRKLLWVKKRVFFLTPQVMSNDLTRNICPGKLVKCLVIDEAHKALGNHSYCQVVKELLNVTFFRVLALSATPGSDINAVQQVITNLNIAHIEIRSEESIDIQPYTHQKTVEKIVVEPDKELTMLIDKFMKVLSFFVDRLVSRNVMSKRDPKSLTKFQFVMAREAFRQDPPSGLARNYFGAVEGDFALCMSLYHAFELLQMYGSRSFYNFMQGMLNGDRSHQRIWKEISRISCFTEIMEDLDHKYKHDSFNQTLLNNSQDPIEVKNDKIIVSHPKMLKLQQILTDFFRNCVNENKDSRAMVFSQYRESVLEITEMLNKSDSSIKAMSFIGQNNKAGKNGRGFTQKEQIMVIRQFKSGGYNTLISTCVGEEGLDIGEVDVIVCYDAPKNPIRLVQRMGRTGRKRQGKIVVLVTKGREENMYNQSIYSKKKIHKALSDGQRLKVNASSNSRMIPSHLSPSCVKLHMKIETYKGNNKQQPLESTSKGSIPSRNLYKNQRKGAFLSDNQLSYWCRNYKMDQEFYQFPSPTLTLNRNSLEMYEISCTPNPSKGKPLSKVLSDWSQWQNLIQPHDLISHSSKTKSYVECLQFLELQNEIKGYDDPYGMEMLSYLDENDIIRPENRVLSAVNVRKRIFTDNLTASTSCMSYDQEKKHLKSGNNNLSRDKVMNSKDIDLQDGAENMTDSEFSDDYNFCSSPDDEQLIKTPPGSSELFEEDRQCLSPVDIDLIFQERDEVAEVIERENELPKEEVKSENIEFSDDDDIFLLNAVNSKLPVTNNEDDREFAEKLVQIENTPTNQFDACDFKFPAINNEGYHQKRINKELLQTENITNLEEIKKSSSTVVINKKYYDVPSEDKDVLLTCEFSDDNDTFLVDALNSSTPIIDESSVRHPGKKYIQKDGVEAGKESCTLTQLLEIANQQTDGEESFTDKGAGQILSVGESSPKVERNDDFIPPSPVVSRRLKKSSKPSLRFSIITDNKFSTPNIANKPSCKSYYKAECTNVDVNSIVASSKRDVSLKIEKETSICEDDLLELALKTEEDYLKGLLICTKSTDTAKPSTSFCDGMVLELALEKEVSYLTGLSTSTPLNKIAAKSTPSKISTPKNTEIAFSDDDFCSPIKTTLTRKVQINLTQGMDDSAENIPVFKNNKRIRRLNLSSIEDGTMVKKRKQSKTRGSTVNEALQFIDAEAELDCSQSLLSGDEFESSQMNEYDRSFINDETQVFDARGRSTKKTSDETMAMYLQSVKSPVKTGKFKLQYQPQNDIDVFSQLSEEDGDDSYERDSFCVDNDQLDLTDSPSSHNISEEIEEPIQKKAPRRKRIISLSSSSNEESTITTPSFNLVKEEVIESSFKSTGFENQDGDNVREQRLLKQKRMRDEFLKKRAKLMNNSIKPNISLGQSSTFSVTVNSEPNSSRYFLNRTSDCSLNESKRKENLTILVSSLEICSSQPLISALKYQHKLKVSTHTIGSCDFIISNRAAIIRKRESDFGNASNRKKLIESLRQMCEQFDRPYLLIEKDAVKKGESRPQNRPHSKYINITTALLAQTHIKMLYSTSTVCSAQLITAITNQEAKKNMEICVQVDLNQDQNKVFNLYLSLPRISCIAALNLLHTFSTFEEFCNSSVKTLQVKGGLSQSRAEEVCKYIRKTFNVDMLPKRT